MVMKFELGEEVQDTVTGFVGVVMGRTEYMTGCTHYGVLARKLHEGKIAEYEWLDETRLVRVSRGVTKPKTRTSGPEQSPTRRMQ